VPATPPGTDKQATAALRTYLNRHASSQTGSVTGIRGQSGIATITTSLRPTTG